jgi:hypothetical protein
MKALEEGSAPKILGSLTVGRGGGTLRLSEELLDRLRIQPGGHLHLVDMGDGSLHLCSSEEVYFYTPEWQGKEREVDEAIADGRFDPPEDVESAIATLRASAA